MLLGLDAELFLYRICLKGIMFLSNILLYERYIIYCETVASNAESCLLFRRDVTVWLEIHLDL